MDGTTTMDHDEDEIKRQMTISAGLAHLDWAQHKINVIDTPGEASFISEALGVLPVVETAVVVVNAVTKVEVQTERVWKRAKELGVSRIAAVNMMDRERADFGEVAGGSQEALWRRGGRDCPAHRQRGGVQGSRRLAVDEGLHVRRHGREGHRECRYPRDMQDARGQGSRGAYRPRGRGRRRSAGEVPGRSGALHRRDHRGPEGSPGGGRGVAGPARRRDQEHRHRPAAGRS